MLWLSHATSRQEDQLNWFNRRSLDSQLDEIVGAATRRRQLALDARLVDERLEQRLARQQRRRRVKLGQQTLQRGV